MLPFGVGFQEVMVVLVVVLLVVGPARLPELAKTLGKGVRAARRAGQELRNAIDIEEPVRQTLRSWENDDPVEDVADCEYDDFGHPISETVARPSAVTGLPGSDGDSDEMPENNPDPNLADTGSSTASTTPVVDVSSERESGDVT